ncbi:hypothetical protein SETIT_8G183200v2 [Setaria italica]|uniref:Uncharacterized protein n=1 Tax=Setaria italica TaxID=4555 RepID=A0A368S9A0_SETIT|nr:hypothetical protein SETIT_8G183200v2 [Setaria italica]
MKLCGSIVSISCDLFCYLTLLYRKRFGLRPEPEEHAPPQRPEPEEHAPPRPLHLSLPCRWFAGTNVLPLSPASSPAGRKEGADLGFFFCLG